MSEFVKQLNETTERVKAALPQMSFSKSGYEIRAHMLEMAQAQLWQDYHAKWGAFNLSVTKEGADYALRVDLPQVPGVEQVLEAAEKFYSFVNKK